MRGHIYFDGGVRPYPSGGFVYCFGWVVMIDGIQVDAGSAIENVRTNENGACAAEFGALNHALLCAQRHLVDAENITIFGDSRAVIDLCSGSAKVRTEWVFTQLELVKAAISSLGNVQFRWIPRKANSIADRLGREAFAKASAKASCLEQRVRLMNRVNALARRKFGNFYDKQAMEMWSQEVTGKRKLANMSVRDLELLINQVRNIPELIGGQHGVRCNTVAQAVPA